MRKQKCSGNRGAKYVGSELGSSFPIERCMPTPPDLPTIILRKWKMKGYEPAYAIIRYDTWYTDYGVQNDMTVKSIVWDAEFANSEVKRLNNLAQSRTRYMVHPTRAKIRDEKDIQK